MQLVIHGRATPGHYFHIANIGHMGNMLRGREDEVQDYPDGYDRDDDQDYDEQDYDEQDYDDRDDRDDDLDGDLDYDLDYDDRDYAEGYGQLVWPGDSRWRPVAAILGVVVALGAVATAVIINSGDSASTKATVGAPAPRPMTSAPTSAPTSPRAPARSTQQQLPPETFTTVPTASGAPSAAPAPTPTGTPTAAPPAVAPPPAAALNPRTVVYSVTGTKQLLDLVNVVYTDARGFPQTEFNVALPWSKVVVLNPGVRTESVIATSFAGGLSCAIVNAEGQPVVTSTNTSIVATCTR